MQIAYVLTAITNTTKCQNVSIVIIIILSPLTTQDVKNALANIK